MALNGVIYYHSIVLYLINKRITSLSPERVNVQIRGDNLRTLLLILVHSATAAGKWVLMWLKQELEWLS